MSRRHSSQEEQPSSSEMQNVNALVEPAAILEAARSDQGQLVTVCAKTLKAFAWLAVFATYLAYQIKVHNVNRTFVVHDSVQKRFLTLLPKRTTDLNRVVAFLDRAIITPGWRDPLCGDGVCEEPYEVRGTTGPGACVADCGDDDGVVRAVVRVSSDFRYSRIPPRTLQQPARWNLCRQDDVRSRAGGADLCYFDGDGVPFDTTQDLQVKDVMLPHGTWYLTIEGDPASRTSGFVVDASLLQGLQQSCCRSQRQQRPQ
ncbi:hypothetical protein PPROV_000364500 [Pycnococcus provasolii]|uniref:Uncharacterized protein n=1 Tax=Pycnococcus provasolii TaxID=41880 RepID=A0A830HEG8_9CHLO|nr:hypothetical protein PPROV_000364500 [Pycnococcus provasolii]